MSTLNLLTPPASPDLLTPPSSPEELAPAAPPPPPPVGPQPDLELIDVSHAGYRDIEFRGRKTKEDIKIKVKDIVSCFNLNVDVSAVDQYLVRYSLHDLCKQDLYSLTGTDDSPTVFSEYAQPQELYIKYEGLDILAHNVPKLAPFRDWLESVIVDLHCHEKIDYDALGW